MIREETYSTIDELGIPLDLVLILELSMTGIGMVVRLRTATSGIFAKAGEGAPLCLSLPFFFPISPFLFPMICLTAD